MTTTQTPVRADRKLVVGTFRSIVRTIPQVKDLSKPRESKLTKGYKVLEFPNQDQLVWWDPDHKVFARGSINCLSCIHYPGTGKPCPEIQDSTPLDQTELKKHDFGGCALHEPIHNWNESNYKTICETVFNGTYFMDREGNLHEIEKLEPKTKTTK